MKNATEMDRRSNVIPLSFKDRRETPSVEVDVNQIPHEIAHPASKHFDVSAGDDPIDEILSEFDEYEVGLEDLDLEESRDDYIFHHQKSWDYQVELKDPNTVMADTILEQIKRLKEDSKRIRYYLQELNLE